MSPRGMARLVALGAAVAAAACTPGGPAPHGEGSTTTVRSALTSDVTVTVLNESGSPQADAEVMAYVEGYGFMSSGWTNSQGQVSFTLDYGQYAFASPGSGAGFFFWSGDPGHCVTPSCTAASITRYPPVVVTVTDGGGNPEVDQAVVAEDAQGNFVNMSWTDAQGHAEISVPSGTFSFVAQVSSVFLTATPAECAVPGCTSASIVVRRVAVTVVDTDSVPQPDMLVVTWNDEGQFAWEWTNQNGVATVALPAGSFHFTTQIDQTMYFSGQPLHCQVGGGCTTAQIVTTKPVIVTVVDGQGQPVADEEVHAFSPDGPTDIVTYTDASGHATFYLPQASWRFKSMCDGQPIYSGAEGHCVVPGCTAAQITLACGDCASAPNGTACNDGSSCTQTDTCQGGACVGGNPVSCSALDQCHEAGTCAPETGVCSNPAKANGASCSDGNSCTGPDTCQAGACTAGANTCSAIAVTHYLNTQTQPATTAVLLADDPSVVPGDPVGFTASVTNTGLMLNMGGEYQIANTGSTTFVVAGFKQTLEYQDVATGVWTPFARLVYDSAGNVVPETTLQQIMFSWVAPILDGSGVTYPTNPGNGNQATGTSIAAGGNAHWSHGGPVLLLPADVVDLIFDPAQSSGIRAVVSFDVPSGPAQSAVNALPFPGVTGDINDVTATLHISIGPQPEQQHALSSSQSGPLAPGATRVYTGTIATPTVFPLGGFAGETEAGYVGRLLSSQFGYAPFVFATGTMPGAFSAQAYGYANIAAELPLIHNPVKTGPAAINAGLTGTYSVTLPNAGNAPATALTLADTVDGSPATISNLTLPASVAAWPASGVASFKYASALARPAGPMTDVAAITWEDGNGAVYGPITATFTGTANAGHPEGYLSMNAATGITDVIGVDKPFVVTALDPLGNPAPGIVVHFVVTGVNPQTADVATGADGKATWAYTGTTMGDDTVVASATVTTTLITLAPVDVQWGTATGTPCSGRATPLDIMLVLDVSRSMVVEPSNVNASAGKLEAARVAAHRFMDNLSPVRDQVGVVVYRGGIDRFVSLSSDPTVAKTQLDSGIDGGLFCATNFCGFQGSNITLALDTALDEVGSPRHRPDATKVVVYIGDGGNEPVVDPTPQLARLRNSGAHAVSIAIGSNVDGALIRQIADSSNDYFYAPSGPGIDFAFNNLNQDLCRNRAPFVSAGGDQGVYGIRLPDLLTLQGEVHDDGPDGDRRLTST